MTHNQRQSGSHGGARRGAGRKPGIRNKRTVATIEAARSAGMLPHEFLCAVSQGQVIDGHVPTFEERVEAAKAAAPFYAPKLTATELSGVVAARYVIRADQPARSIDEWQRKHVPEGSHTMAICEEVRRRR